MPHRYAIEIISSDEDEGFIAVVPELPGCSAFGETEEEALREVKVAVSLWLEAAHEEGRVIPEPAGRERLRDILARGDAAGVNTPLFRVELATGTRQDDPVLPEAAFPMLPEPTDNLNRHDPGPTPCWQNLIFCGGKESSSSINSGDDRWYADINPSSRKFLPFLSASFRSSGINMVLRQSAFLALCRAGRTHRNQIWI